MLAVGLIIVVTYGGGCATVTTGKYQEVPITSVPVGVKVTSDTGLSITTPGKLTLLRNRSHTLVAEYPGCEPQQIEVKNKTQGWFWGNILLGGIIGGAVDITSGACDELVPKDVQFDFTSTGQAIARRKRLYFESHPDTNDEIRFAIMHEMGKKGMTKDELIAGLGEPNRIDKTRKYEKFIYDNRKPKCYYFKEGTLEKA